MKLGDRSPSIGQATGMDPWWVPLTQGYSYGEGSDPLFRDLPTGHQATRDDGGDWGYWEAPDPLPADWLHAQANPLQGQVDAARNAAAMVGPWGTILGLVNGNYDPAKGLYDIPTSYSSLDEMLQNPMWWGAQDLVPSVQAEVLKDPRAAYASLHSLYQTMPGADVPDVATPPGYVRLTGALNGENTWPKIGAEGGYRSMQDLGWEPGYGIVARQGSFIPEQNEDWQKLAVGLLVSGAMGGAMAGAFAPAGTAGAAMPAAGKAAWGLAQAAYNKNPLSALGALGNAGSAAGLWSPQAGGWFNTGVGALSSLNSAAGDPLGLRGGNGRAGPAGGAAPLTQLAQQPAATPTEQALRQQTLNVPSLALRPGLI